MTFNWKHPQITHLWTNFIFNENWSIIYRLITILGKNFVLDHTVDIHFESSANSKYQYSLYVHPKEAGIVFTMPKRVIALEGKVDLPTGKGKVGPIKGEVAFWMNKNAEPDKKTVLSFVSDQNVHDKGGHVNLEVKFNNPNLNKVCNTIQITNTINFIVKK